MSRRGEKCFTAPGGSTPFIGRCADTPLSYSRARARQKNKNAHVETVRRRGEAKPRSRRRAKHAAITKCCCINPSVSLPERSPNPSRGFPMTRARVAIRRSGGCAGSRGCVNRPRRRHSLLRCTARVTAVSTMKYQPDAPGKLERKYFPRVAVGFFNDGARAGTRTISCRRD